MTAAPTAANHGRSPLGLSGVRVRRRQHERYSPRGGVRRARFTPISAPRRSFSKRSSRRNIPGGGAALHVQERRRGSRDADGFRLSPHKPNVGPLRLAFSRVVVAASGKFPNIGRAFYEPARFRRDPPRRGTGRSRKGWRAESSRSRAGGLAVRRPLPDYVYKRLLFGDVDTVTPQEIEASVKAGVDVFLTAYGV